MKNKISLIVLLFLLTGCAQENDDKFAEAKNKFESELQSLNERIELLEKRAADSAWEHVALLAPNEARAWTFTNEEGHHFVISLDKVEKYANGYKATLYIGNPGYITFAGAKLKISWGAKGKRKTQDFAIMKSILPGAWNVVDVVLAPAKEEDLDLIMVKIETDEFLLKKDLRQERR